MLMINNSTKFYIYFIYRTSSHKIFLGKQIRFDLFWHSSPVRATADTEQLEWGWFFNIDNLRLYETFLTIFKFDWFWLAVLDFVSFYETQKPCIPN